MVTFDRPLFPTGQVHLIGISESLEALRVVHDLLSQAGIGPPKLAFADAGLGRWPMVADIESEIRAETETLVIFNIAALVGYKVRSRERIFKLMEGLRRVALDNNVAVIGITKTTDCWGGRQQIAGSTAWGEAASTVVTVHPGSTADTIAVSLDAPNMKPQEFELVLSKQYQGVAVRTRLAKTR